MNFIQWLLSLIRNNPKYTGAIRDERTSKQMAGAYDARELVTSFPVEWKEKTEWKSYPIRRQFYTGQCVAHSIAKHLGINNLNDYGKFIPLSAEFFYYFRVNKPTAGMVWLDAMKLATSIGSCYDHRIIQRVRESEPETIPTVDMKEEAKQFRGSSFIEDKERTLESIARIIEERGSCLLWFWFEADGGSEYWRVEPKIVYPNMGTYDSNATRHALVATDYGIRNGKKVIKIEDSAGNSSALNEQDRFIDADFMKRCFVAGFVIDLPNVTVVPIKPKFTGTRTLKLGMSGNDVKELQAILKYYKLFPDLQTLTGFLGGITRMGVIRLQEKFADEILKPLGLTKGTGICGVSTLAWLKKHHG